MCGAHWEVVKRVAEIDNPEFCPKCKTHGVRYIAGRQSFYGAEVEDAYYCPALGTVVKNKNHRKKIAKDRGLEEVGNDDPPNNFDSYEKIREQRAKDRYAEFFEPIRINTRA